jgi:WhiB family redox-sensing transcriptional regulator
MIAEKTPAWFADAACKGMTDMFFGEKLDYHLRQKALATCATCPVIEPCREYALKLSQHLRLQGVWGGLTQKQRRIILKEMKIKIVEEELF